MEFDERVQLFIEGIANDVTSELVKSAPVDTGRLRNSIKYRISDGVITFYMVDYALHVEFGTKPHIIVPKDAKALHWKSGGKDVFAKKVNHPGTIAQPFIRNTFYHKLKSIMLSNAEKYIPEVADELEVATG